MEIVGIFSIVILLFGILSHQIPWSKKSTNPSTVLSTIATPTPILSPSHTPTPIPVKPTKTPTPTPTRIDRPQSSSPSSSSTPHIQDFRYPTSLVTSSQDSSLMLTSTDSPDTITSWYKQKIQSLDMNAKSFVTTKSNDKVLNKLVGAGRGIEISVTITQENTSSSVIIEVHLQTT